MVKRKTWAGWGRHIRKCGKNQPREGACEGSGRVWSGLGGEAECEACEVENESWVEGQGDQEPCPASHL